MGLLEAVIVILIVAILCAFLPIPMWVLGVIVVLILLAVLAPHFRGRP